MVRLKECQFADHMKAEKSTNNQWVSAIEMDKEVIWGTITVIAAKEDPKKFLHFLSELCIIQCTVTIASARRPKVS